MPFCLGSKPTVKPSMCCGAIKTAMTNKDIPLYADDLSPPQSGRMHSYTRGRKMCQQLPMGVSWLLSYFPFIWAVMYEGNIFQFKKLLSLCQTAFNVKCMKIYKAVYQFNRTIHVYCSQHLKLPFDTNSQCAFANCKLSSKLLSISESGKNLTEYHKSRNSQL